jgi:hypothetical protein
MVRDGLAVLSDFNIGSVLPAIMEMGNDLRFYHAPIRASSLLGRIYLVRNLLLNQANPS